MKYFERIVHKTGKLGRYYVTNYLEYEVYMGKEGSRLSTLAAFGSYLYFPHYI